MAIKSSIASLVSGLLSSVLQVYRQFLSVATSDISKPAAIKFEVISVEQYQLRWCGSSKDEVRRKQSKNDRLNVPLYSTASNSYHPRRSYLSADHAAYRTAARPHSRSETSTPVSAFSFSIAALLTGLLELASPVLYIRLK
jgi:hypothetical protein